MRSLWHDALMKRPAPPAWVVVVSFASAAAAVWLPRLWRVSRQVITIAHEAGHAGVALLAGRRLGSIRLHSDSSGLTVTSGRPRGAGMVATLAAGYVTPSLLGMGMAWLVASRRITAVLLCGFIVLMAMVVAIRNVFGLLSLGVCAVATAAVVWSGSSTLQAAFAWTLTWFLLLGGPRPIWELRRWRRGRRGPTSDVDQLAALTHIPAVAWTALLAVVSVAALGVGARWLVLTSQ